MWNREGRGVKPTRPTASTRLQPAAVYAAQSHGWRDPRTSPRAPSDQFRYRDLPQEGKQYRGATKNYGRPQSPYTGLGDCYRRRWRDARHFSRRRKQRQRSARLMGLGLKYMARQNASTDRHAGCGGGRSTVRQPCAVPTHSHPGFRPAKAKTAKLCETDATTLNTTSSRSINPREDLQGVDIREVRQKSLDAISSSAGSSPG